MRSEIGSVLILVLILLIAISFLSAHLMRQGTLTAKLAVGFQAQFVIDIDAENRLIEEEKKIKKTPALYINNLVAFVPDHLEFGCWEGVEIFKVSVPPLQSFMAIRTP